MEQFSKKKQLPMYKNSKLRNFQLKMDGLKDGRLDPIRNSQQTCSLKKSVLRNFAKFTGKQLCQSFFFNKVAGALGDCFWND